VAYRYLDAPVPLAFAHRGGAAHGDENTLASFGRAVAAGYRYLETDVHGTADGVAVVFHDDTLDRVLGRAGRVRELRWADLATIRVGGEPVVPRLDDVLGSWPEVRFNVDVKADPGVQPTVDAVRRAGALHRVLLTSFKDARTARMRAALGPELATSPGVRGAARLWAASRVGVPVRVPYAAAQVPVRPVDARFVRYVHGLGMQVHVWTVDDPGRIGGLLDLGVDGIMTDHIDVLRDVYTARGCWAA
jgi:glycerophosphoryl diester phosphodiesterase